MKKQLIHKAIKKYGKEHFYFDVLESNIDLSVLEDKEKIADMYEYGLSTNEIAKIMNRDVKTVRRYKQYECCA